MQKKKNVVKVLLKKNGRENVDGEVFEDPNDVFGFNKKRVNQMKKTMVSNSGDEDIFGPSQVTPSKMIARKMMTMKNMRKIRIKRFLVIQAQLLGKWKMKR